MDLIGAAYMRDVDPGRDDRGDATGLHPVKPFPRRSTSQCIFEQVYFARPDSFVFGETSTRCARAGTAAGAGTAGPSRRRDADARLRRVRGRRVRRSSGNPDAEGSIRNHYVGRTFIQPQQAIRHFGVA